MENSILSKNVIPEMIKNRSITEVPYVLKPLLKGFKYLGFILKPNAYSFKDWLWLYKKIEGRIK